MQNNGKDSLLISKVLYPMCFHSEYIKSYSGLNDELKSLIDTSGYKNQFLSKYNKALTFLEKLKNNCIMQNKLFECLKNESGLHSMIIFGRKNIRILFYFTVKDGVQVAVLLHCFEEKKTTDYVRAIKIAHERREEAEESLL